MKKSRLHEIEHEKGRHPINKTPVEISAQIQGQIQVKVQKNQTIDNGFIEKPVKKSILIVVPNGKILFDKIEIPINYLIITDIIRSRFDIFPLYYLRNRLDCNIFSETKLRCHVFFRSKECFCPKKNPIRLALFSRLLYN